MYFCIEQLFFILSSARREKKKAFQYTTFEISHNYITGAGFKISSMNGVFTIWMGVFTAPGSSLKRKCASHEGNKWSFLLKSTVCRPEWMTTPDKVKQTQRPIHLKPQSYWSSHTVHTHTHVRRLVHTLLSALSPPPCARLLVFSTAFCKLAPVLIAIAVGGYLCLHLQVPCKLSV